MPFCWQPKAALARIEQSLELGKAATAKAVYVALTRIASDRECATFQVPITHVAAFASLNRRTVERRLPDLERLGLVTIQRSIRRTEHVYILLTLSRHDTAQSRSDATAQRGLGDTPLLFNNYSTIKEEKKNTPAPCAVVIPSILDTPEFQAAWKEWMDYRLSLRKSKKPQMMFAGQLSWLAQFPSRNATEILRQSIRNGWQGLFPLKHDQNSRTDKPNPRNAGIATDASEHGRRLAEALAKRQQTHNPSV